MNVTSKSVAPPLHVSPLQHRPRLGAGGDGADHDESLPLPAGDQLLAGPAQAHGQSGNAEARDDGGQAGGSGLNKFGRGTGQIMQQRKHIEENKKNQNQKNEMNSKERRERNKKFKKRLETILWKVSNFQEVSYIDLRKNCCIRSTIQVVA